MTGQAAPQQQHFVPTDPSLLMSRLGTAMAGWTRTGSGTWTGHGLGHGYGHVECEGSAAHCTTAGLQHVHQQWSSRRLAAAAASAASSRQGAIRSAPSTPPTRTLRSTSRFVRLFVCLSVSHSHARRFTSLSISSLEKKDTFSAQRKCCSVAKGVWTRPRIAPHHFTRLLRYEAIGTPLHAGLLGSAAGLMSCRPGPYHPAIVFHFRLQIDQRGPLDESTLLRANICLACGCSSVSSLDPPYMQLNTSCSPSSGSSTLLLGTHIS